jgi:hypothetical protein
MNIEKTGLTYQPVSGAMPSTRPAPKPSDRTDAAPDKTSGSDRKAVTQPSLAASEAGPALTDYLSREEKDMLNVLFPPQGRDVGIKAYRNGAVQTQAKDHVGKNVDLTT